jgi:hypothetical protein
MRLMIDLMPGAAILSWEGDAEMHSLSAKQRQPADLRFHLCHELHPSSFRQQTKFTCLKILLTIVQAHSDADESVEIAVNRELSRAFVTRLLAVCPGQPWLPLGNKPMFRSPPHLEDGLSYKKRSH